MEKYPRYNTHFSIEFGKNLYQLVSQFMTQNPKTQISGTHHYFLMKTTHNNLFFHGWIGLRHLLLTRTPSWLFSNFKEARGVGVESKKEEIGTDPNNTSIHLLEHLEFHKGCSKVILFLCSLNISHPKKFINFWKNNKFGNSFSSEIYIHKFITLQ